MIRKTIRVISTLICGLFAMSALSIIFLGLRSNTALAETWTIGGSILLAVSIAVWAGVNGLTKPKIDA